MTLRSEQQRELMAVFLTELSLNGDYGLLILQSKRLQEHKEDQSHINRRGIEVTKSKR